MARAHALGPKALLDLNLTIGQLKSLFFIGFEGSTNVSRLAEALGVTPPNITGIVDRLVEQGLVSRQENPENRRMTLLKLTEKGNQTLNKLRINELSHISTILNKLTVEELSALVQGLSALVRVTKQIEGEERDEHD